MALNFQQLNTSGVGNAFSNLAQVRLQNKQIAEQKRIFEEQKRQFEKAERQRKKAERQARNVARLSGIGAIGGAIAGGVLGGPGGAVVGSQVGSVGGQVAAGQPASGQQVASVGINAFSIQQQVAAQEQADADRQARQEQVDLLFPGAAPTAAPIGPGAPFGGGAVARQTAPLTLPQQRQEAIRQLALQQFVQGGGVPALSLAAELSTPAAPPKTTTSEFERLNTQLAQMDANNIPADNPTRQRVESRIEFLSTRAGGKEGAKFEEVTGDVKANLVERNIVDEDDFVQKNLTSGRLHISAKKGGASRATDFKIVDDQLIDNSDPANPVARPIKGFEKKKGKAAANDINTLPEMQQERQRLREAVRVEEDPGRAAEIQQDLDEMDRLILKELDELPEPPPDPGSKDFGVFTDPTDARTRQTAALMTEPEAESFRREFGGFVSKIPATASPPAPKVDSKLTKRNTLAAQLAGRLESTAKGSFADPATTRQAQQLLDSGGSLGPSQRLRLEDALWKNRLGAGEITQNRIASANTGKMFELAQLVEREGSRSPEIASAAMVQALSPGNTASPASKEALFDAVANMDEASKESAYRKSLQMVSNAQKNVSATAQKEAMREFTNNAEQNTLPKNKDGILKGQFAAIDNILETQRKEALLKEAEFKLVRTELNATDADREKLERGEAQSTINKAMLTFGSTDTPDEKAKATAAIRRLIESENFTRVARTEDVQRLVDMIKDEPRNLKTFDTFEGTGDARKPVRQVIDIDTKEVVLSLPRDTPYDSAISQGGLTLRQAKELNDRLRENSRDFQFASNGLRQAEKVVVKGDTATGADHSGLVMQFVRAMQPDVQVSDGERIDTAKIASFNDFVRNTLGGWTTGQRLTDTQILNIRNALETRYVSTLTPQLANEASIRAAGNELGVSETLYMMSWDADLRTPERLEAAGVAPRAGVGAAMAPIGGFTLEIFDDIPPAGVIAVDKTPWTREAVQGLIDDPEVSLEAILNMLNAETVQ